MLKARATGSTRMSDLAANEDDINEKEHEPATNSAVKQDATQQGGDMLTMEV